MTKFILILFASIYANSYSQTISDSTIAKIANFNCNCQDTIDLNKSNEIISNQLRECYTKSLMTCIYEGDLTQDYLNDNIKLKSLQNEVFNLLANCNKTIQIAQKLNYAPMPSDSLPLELFIAEDFFSKYGLKKGETGKNFVVWNSDKNNKIQRVVDIRWFFKTHKDALEYHKIKLTENSENGQEININYQLNKAVDLHVFKESQQMENMIKMLKLPQRQYYFLFVIDNVAFKIFVATDKTVESKDVIFIIEEAINRMKNYKH